MVNKPASKSSIKLKICDMHTCGMPVRIIEAIEPPINYSLQSDISMKNKYFSENFDHIRKMTMLEPRGHSNMFGVIIIEQKESNNYGLIFMHSYGYVSMCGHVTIAIARYLLEKNLIEKKIPETKMEFDCMSGIIQVSVEWDGNTVGNTKFVNVPSFVQQLDYEIFIPEFNKDVKCDIVFSGNFFALVSVKSLGVEFDEDSRTIILTAANHFMNALKSNLFLYHPENKDLEYLAGVYITDGNKSNDIVNVICAYANQAYDRSPCGSGTAGLITSQFFRGNMEINQCKITQNAFLGKDSKFQGRLIETLDLENEKTKIQAVKVEITGRAYFCGESTLIFEEDDYFKFGFVA